MAAALPLARARVPSSGFRFPGGDARTCIIGTTGSGKTTCGLWMLSHQRFTARPWIAFDFKREVLFDRVGFPPIAPISLADRPPRKPGLYLVSPRPGQDDAIEAFLWRVWEQENIGLYIDEAGLLPDQSDAFKAILQQGRSKRLPVIGCTQRPVDVVRALFTEANYTVVYHLFDKRDWQTLQGLVPVDMSSPLPWRHWWWFDREHRRLLHMSPVPHPEIVVNDLITKLPVVSRDWHPLKWIGRKTGRDSLKILG